MTEATPVAGSTAVVVSPLDVDLSGDMDLLNETALDADTFDFYDISC